MHTRRSLFSLAVTAALVLSAVLVPSTASADSLDTVVGDFENGSLWSFSNGSEFPGATGGIAADPDAHSGAASARLSADFTAGGKYVAMSKNAAIDVVSLSFWVKSTTGTRLALRAVDSTGQTHQQRISLTPGTDWQHLVVTDFAAGSGYSHFGGANDGVWHGPSKTFSILVDENSFGGAKTGSILVDDVVATKAPSTLALDQVAEGNVFVEGETPAVDIQSSGDAVAWTLTGLDGVAVDSGTVSMASPVERLSFAGLDLGYYTLSATASSSGTVIGTASTVIALLVEHGASPVDSPFGMAAHMTRWDAPDFTLTDLLADAGVAHVRDDASWASVETAPGSYSYVRYDGMVAKLDAAGIDWLPIPAYTNAFYDGNATPYTDEGRSAYGDFAVALTDHYDSTAVEIYNEFNLPGFGDRGDGPADAKAEYYYPLLKKAYEDIKAVDPDRTVVGGATAGVPLAWLETLFQLGGLQYMDALSIHPYLYPGSPAGLDTLIDQVNALVKKYNNGQTIPIWITEQGWVTGTNARAVSEQTQADYIVQAHVRAFAKGVQRYFWYDFMDDGTDAGNVENRFGIVRNTADQLGKWTAKPAYVAYSTLTDQLQAADFDRVETAPAGVSCYVFDEGGADKRVVWSTTPSTVALAATGPVTVTDQQGRETTLQPANGAVELTVGATPVYIAGAVTGVTSSRLSLTLPASVAIDDTFTATLGVDNSDGTAPLSGEFTLDGQTVAVEVAAGATAEFPVSLTAGRDLGARSYRGELRVGGALVATVEGTVTVKNRIGVTARHALRDSGDVLEVTVSNASVGAVPADEIAYTMGTTSGTAAVPEVPADGGVVVDVPLAGLAPGTYPTSVSYEIDGLPAATSSTTTVMVDAAAQRVLAHQVTASDAAPLDLTADGTNAVTGWEGEADLSGTIQPTWDAEGLHLHATIADDVQAQPNSGEQIWAGDSIQFTVQAGMPGETKPWDEIGIALTATGPVVWKWVAGSGETGEVAGAEASIVRDDAAATTTYDLTLPWSAVAPADPATRLVSMSFVVNDDDGAGRTGWIEVGSGIARSKDNALYLPFVLEPAPPAPVCDATVDQDVRGSLTLTEGLTCITGVTVSGPVTVTGGASVTITDSVVKGIVLAQGADAVTVTGSEVRGALSVQGATGAVLVEGSTIAGIGSFTGSTGGVTVSGNTVSGALTCSGNDPAPTNGGVANTITGAATGQCAGF
ncbi:hypothetical protein IF188_10390 [Microbacterium sp. NEAU-LLC]|uniref:Asl1-like glycosyl hydrolase catalytic domain-containing protein n=1 Tax=Microbacterium helvum TaxID=2773713 RepID=A0ABR8NN71_9MICO|nr:glycosyl hydrolase [Microbacterium helvum]MBD3942105.1 hypothetical protein [Microbacterium helvum]